MITECGQLGEGPAIGEVLAGAWRIDARVGGGGMATVYAVTHRCGHRAAIKLLHPSIAADPLVVERFLREGYISNRVNHRGTVRALDVGRWHGIPFLVMDLLEGESLEARRARAGGRLGAAEVAATGLALLEVLAAAHREGIVHRDVKPENVFRTNGGEIKVLDFGIARMRHGGAPTAASAVMGTLDFMAPEQAASPHEVDARTDVWATGATLYALLSGAPPHVSSTVLERVLRAEEPVRSIGEVVRGLPPSLTYVIDRALRPEPEERWQDAQSMSVALRLAFTHTLVVAAAPSLR